MKNIPPQQLRTNKPRSQSDGSVIHKPVLLEDAVALLAPQNGQRYLDLTAGYGGHASRIIEAIGDFSHATLVDRDERAIRYLKTHGFGEARLVQSDYASAVATFVAAGEQFDMVLVDLGVSSPQLDMAERGFSIQRDGPLDMRMDESGERTAADIVNRTSESELAYILETYGEESARRARMIARAIRLNRPVTTTSQLAAIVLNTHRGTYHKIHPATRTFQAIRIALNDELGQLKALLPHIPRLLTKHGRVAVISFHSLEDRLVKQYFAEQSRAGYEAELKLLTKRPILGVHDDVHNPRARSAVLRAAVKI